MHGPVITTVSDRVTSEMDSNPVISVGEVYGSNVFYYAMECGFGGELFVLGKIPLSS